MDTECPACQEAVTFELSQIEESSEVVCSSCLITLNLKVILEPVAELSEVSLDVDGSEEEIQTPRDEPSPFPEADVSPHSVKKVLLCVEGEATRQLVQAILFPENIQIIDIASEIDALVYADCPSPDIALIDLDLKRNPEVDLCAEIKKNAVFKDSAIIVIGSMFEKNTRYRDEEPVFPGADDFIDRYYLEKKLLEKVMGEESSASDGLPEAEPSANSEDQAEYDMEDASSSDFSDSPEDVQEVGEVQEIVKSAEDAMLSVQDMIEEGAVIDGETDLLAGETEILDEKIVVPDFTEESFDGSGVTGLANQAMSDMDGLLETEESDPMGVDFSDPAPSEFEAHDEENETPVSLVLNPEETSDLDEQILDLETGDLFDDQAGEEEGELSLVDESFEADFSGSDMIQEESEPEHDESVPQESVISDFSDEMEEESSEVKTAKRLARIIVSDIVIYNEKKVEEGLQTGQFFEILSEEIDEGRQLYHSRVDKDRLESDYLQEALSDYVNKKTSLSSS